MGCNCFPRTQTGCPEDGTWLQRLHGGVNDLMAGHCATRRRCGRRRVGCAICRLRLAVDQTGMHGTAMMPSVVVMGLMLGASAMVASGASALHTGRTPSRARQDEREHREQDQYGAGAAAHAGKMIWRSSRIARPPVSATHAPSDGLNLGWWHHRHRPERCTSPPTGSLRHHRPAGAPSFREAAGRSGRGPVAGWRQPITPPARGRGCAAPRPFARSRPGRGS